MAPHATKNRATSLVSNLTNRVLGRSKRAPYTSQESLRRVAELLGHIEQRRRGLLEPVDSTVVMDEAHEVCLVWPTNMPAPGKALKERVLEAHAGVGRNPDRFDDQDYIDSFHAAYEALGDVPSSISLLPLGLAKFGNASVPSFLLLQNVFTPDVTVPVPQPYFE